VGAGNRSSHHNRVAGSYGRIAGRDEFRGADRLSLSQQVAYPTERVRLPPAHQEFIAIDLDGLAHCPPPTDRPLLRHQGGSHEKYRRHQMKAIRSFAAKRLSYRGGRDLGSALGVTASAIKQLQFCAHEINECAQRAGHLTAARIIEEDPR
jgi:hypothetical protein